MAIGDVLHASARARVCDRGDSSIDPSIQAFHHMNIIPACRIVRSSSSAVNLGMLYISKQGLLDALVRCRRSDPSPRQTQARSCVSLRMGPKNRSPETNVRSRARVSVTHRIDPASCILARTRLVHKTYTMLTYVRKLCMQRPEYIFVVFLYIFFPRWPAMNMY